LIYKLVLQQNMQIKFLNKDVDILNKECSRLTEALAKTESVKLILYLFILIGMLIAHES